MTTTYSTRCVAADLARRVLNAVLAVPAGRSEGMSTRRLHFALPHPEVWPTCPMVCPASLDAAHMTISRPAAVADLRGSVPTTRQQRKPKRGDKSQAVPKRRREAFASDRTTSCAAFGDASTTAPVFLRQQLNLTALRGQPPYGLSNTPHWKLEAMLRAASAPPSNAYKRCAVVGNAGSLLLGEAGAEIDAHDAVFRVNKAPWTPELAKHIGSRTTVQPQILSRHTQLDYSSRLCCHAHAAPCGLVRVLRPRAWSSPRPPPVPLLEHDTRACGVPPHLRIPDLARLLPLPPLWPARRRILLKPRVSNLPPLRNRTAAHLVGTSW